MCFMNVENLKELDAAEIFETLEDLTAFVVQLNSQFGEEVYRLVNEKNAV